MYDFSEKYALYSYEQLLLKQPQFKTEGIYKKDTTFLIKCDNVNIQPLNSKYQSIVDAFDNEIRIAGCPIELVTELPDNATKLEMRKPLEVINLSGNPFNNSEFNNQLSLLLPKNLPNLHVKFNHLILGWDIIVERELSLNEKDVVSEKINIICGSKVTLNYIVDFNVKNQFSKEIQNPLSIIVSKHSTVNYNRAVMDKWEEDEQIWVDNRKELFLDESLHEGKKKLETSSCLINGSFGDAHDIRNYLTLFSEIKIVVPIEPRYEALLKSLNIKEDELLKLIELNKVKLLFPHSLNRYNKGIIEKSAAINPNNIIFSRELAYLTVNDLKQRNPIVFLPQTVEEKNAILSDLLELAVNSSDGSTRKWLEGIINELSNTWSNMYENLSIRAALGTFNVGLGPIINTTIKNLTGKDYFIEIMEAANSIEWAAANQAILCPVGPLAQNEVNLAHLYSGVRNDWNLSIVTNPNVATEEILSIANYVPVLELAETFSGPEIDRFRKILINLTCNKKPEELEMAIQQFNDSVKRFERIHKHLETWDIKGVTLDAAMEVSNMAIPFSGFITKQLGRVLNYFGNKNSTVEKVIRNAEAKIHMTSPNVILVSRMRDKIKDLL